MGTATVQTNRFSWLTTGSGLQYPVVMKAPFDITPFVDRFAIKDSAEIAIGDICILTAAGVLDASSSAVATVPFIVLDTVWNKSILEGHGTTPSKSAKFTAGDKVDVLMLVPGLILSMKVEAKADVIVGTKLLANDTAGQLTGGVTAGAVIGIALAELDWTDVDDEMFYIPVLVK